LKNANDFPSLPLAPNHPPPTQILPSPLKIAPIPIDMPHIVLEHTNLPINARELLLALNTALTQAYPEEFPVPEAIKSRAINVGEDYAIGINADAQDSLKFIHTNIRILSNRPDEVRAGIAKTATKAINEYLAANLKYDGQNVQCTVEIGELWREGFSKVVYDGKTQ